MANLSDLRQELCRDGGDGGEDAERGEALTAVASPVVVTDTLGLVALVPVAEADVDVVVDLSTILNVK